MAYFFWATLYKGDRELHNAGLQSKVPYELDPNRALDNKCTTGKKLMTDEKKELKIVIWSGSSSTAMIGEVRVYMDAEYFNFDILSKFCSERSHD